MAEQRAAGGARMQLPEGRITDEALADLRAMIGRQLRPERYIREATIDTITNFCNGIGDLNPLHRDSEHARWTRWGTIIAPVCFLYARTWPGRTRFGLPGVHGFHAGNDFRCFRPVRLGDRIDSVERLVAVQEKTGRFSGRMVIVTVETTFTNQRGDRVACVLGWNTRHERAAARERGKEARNARPHETEARSARPYEYAADELQRDRGTAAKRG